MLRLAYMVCRCFLFWFPLCCVLLEHQDEERNYPLHRGRVLLEELIGLLCTAPDVMLKAAGREWCFVFGGRCAGG